MILACLAATVHWKSLRLYNLNSEIRNEFNQNLFSVSSLQLDIYKKKSRSIRTETFRQNIDLRLNFETPSSDEVKKVALGLKSKKN